MNNQAEKCLSSFSEKNMKIVYLRLKIKGKNIMRQYLYPHIVTGKPCLVSDYVDLTNKLLFG